MYGKVVKSCGECGKEITLRLQDEAVRVLLSFPPSSGNLLAYVKMHRELVGTAWGMPRLPYPVILNGNAVIYDTWQLVAIVELSSLG